jgi:hypothetical protein
VSKNFLFVLSIVVLMAIPSEILPRGGTSSSKSSSSSSKSSSYSKPSSSSSFSSKSSNSNSSVKKAAILGTAAAGVAVAGSVTPSTPPTTPDNTTKSNVSTRNVSQSSTIKNTPTQSFTSKPKAVSNNSIDKKQAKAIASQNNNAAKTYGSKANAEKAFREKLSTSNKYTSPTPPAVRPANIPQTIVINNTSVSPSYGMLPGGHYGYGYYDPMTNMMVALAANQMMVDNAMMRQSGYGQWDDSGRSVVVHEPSSSSAIVLVLVILGAVAIAFFVIRKIM